MNKQDVLKNLYNLFDVDIEDRMQMDPQLENDVIMAGKTNTPVFRSLFDDGYSGIDRTKNPGAYALEVLLRVYAFEEDYSTDITELLLSLMLNRDLNLAEKEIANDVTALCNYAQDSKDQDLKDIIRGVLSKTRWDEYYLLPPQVCLFLLRGDEKDIKGFWEDLADCMCDAINIVNIIQKHS